MHPIDGRYIYALFSSGGHFSWIALPSGTPVTKAALRHQERYFYRGGKLSLESDTSRIHIQNTRRFTLIMKDRRIPFRRYQ